MSNYTMGQDSDMSNNNPAQPLYFGRVPGKTLSSSSFIIAILFCLAPSMPYLLYGKSSQETAFLPLPL